MSRRFIDALRNNSNAFYPALSERDVQALKFHPRTYEQAHEAVTKHTLDYGPGKTIWTNQYLKDLAIKLEAKRGEKTFRLEYPTSQAILVFGNRQVWLPYAIPVSSPISLTALSEAASGKGTRRFDTLLCDADLDGVPNLVMVSGTDAAEMPLFTLFGREFLVKPRKRSFQQIRGFDTLGPDDREKYLALFEEGMSALIEEIESERSAAASA